MHADHEAETNWEKSMEKLFISYVRFEFTKIQNLSHQFAILTFRIYLHTQQ